MLSITNEDYLKQVWLLSQEADGPVAMGRLAGAVGVAPGTATAMMKKLAEDGLVEYEPYVGVELTRQGRQQAVAVLRRHRLIETFLVEALGLDWSEVHEEAERLEHAISDRLLERIDDFLGRPHTDPHGDPSPNARGVFRETSRQSLADCAIGRSFRIARISDQDSSFLQYVDAHGLRPGTKVVVQDRDHTADAVHVRPERGEVIAMGGNAAEKLLVEPVHRR